MTEPTAALPPLFLLLVLFGVLLFILEIRALSYAYRVIGISPRYVTLVLLLTLVGGYVNVPITTAGAGSARTVIAMNVGGALIPVLVSLFLFARTERRARMIFAVALVATIVHRLAVVVPEVGIAIPMLIPPLAATAVALLLAFREAPPVAYVSGSLGTLIGADLWNLPRVVELGAPMVSIGGAGTFDGVFLTGIIAGVLAAWIGPKPRVVAIPAPVQVRERGRAA